MNMPEPSKKKESKESREDSNTFIVFLELLTETLAWFAIVISLSFFAGIIGFIMYLIISGKLGLIIGIVIGSAGVITSFIYACYIWKTSGTVNFISNSSWRNRNTNIEE